MEYFLAHIIDYKKDNSYYELVKANNIDEARDIVQINMGYECDVEISEPLQ